MKRIRSPKHDYLTDDYSYEDDISLQSRTSRSRIQEQHTLEADVLEGDTLQAISLRFNCTIADIKRLNKIDKEFEIHARKTIRVPLNAFNLLEQIPEVHKSGSNSPKTINQQASTSRGLENSNLDEKLILASISNATYKNTDTYRDAVRPENDLSGFEDSLLINSNPIPMRRPRNDLFAIDGSDCDLNWICLLVFIIACCIIVPLIYVLWIYEHPEFHPAHSPYDDPDHSDHHHHLNMSHHKTT